MKYFGVLLYNRNNIPTFAARIINNIIIINHLTINLMRIKKLLSAGAIAALALLGFSANAGNVDVNAARMAAKNFFNQHAGGQGSLRAAANADIKLAHTEASSVEGNAYYVFNIQGGGWVIVAGDDRAKQVLAYGEKGNIDMNDLPDNMKGYLNMLKGQIETAQAYKGETAPRKAPKLSSPIGPLMKTDWGQGDPWNRLCPMNGSKRTSVGCGPLAMAQIMYYWKYPTEVDAVPGYSISWTQYMSELPATTFDYNLILDSYYFYDPETGSPSSVDFTEAEADEVAKLCRYCGQACKSRYGNGESGTGTGSYTYDQRDAFKLFGFNENMQLIGKDPTYYCANYGTVYTDEEWVALINTELEAGRPIPYHDMWEGHAWVLDGVDADGKFHMNWGFNGKFNGWFELNALIIVPYDDEDEEWDFSHGSNGYNEMIIGMYPYDGYVIPGTATTPRPTISYQLDGGSITFTANGLGEIHMYIDGQEVTIPYTMSLGDAEVTVVVSATAQEEGASISDTAEKTYILPVASYIRGDVNNDGKVSINDVTTLINYLLGSPETIIVRNDVNLSGAVNISDVTDLIKYLLSKQW